MLTWPLIAMAAIAGLVNTGDHRSDGTAQHDLRRHSRDETSRVGGVGGAGLLGPPAPAEAWPNGAPARAAPRQLSRERRRELLTGDATTPLPYEVRPPVISRPLGERPGPPWPPLAEVAGGGLAREPGPPARAHDDARLRLSQAGPTPAPPGLLGELRQLLRAGNLRLDAMRWELPGGVTVPAGRVLRISAVTAVARMATSAALAPTRAFSREADPQPADVTSTLTSTSPGGVHPVLVGIGAAAAITGLGYLVLNGLRERAPANAASSPAPVLLTAMRLKVAGDLHMLSVGGRW